MPASSAAPESRSVSAAGTVTVASLPDQLCTNHTRRPSATRPDETRTAEPTIRHPAAIGSGTAQRISSAPRAGLGTVPTTVMRPSPCLRAS